MVNSVLAKLDQKLLSPIKEDGIQLIYYIVCIMVKISFIRMIVGLVFDIITQVIPTLIALLQVPSYSFVNFGARLIYAISGIVPYIIFTIFRQYLSKKSLKELDSNILNLIVGSYFILNVSSHLFYIFSVIQNFLLVGDDVHISQVFVSIIVSVLSLAVGVVYVIIGVRHIKSSGYLKSDDELAEIKEL